MKIIQILRAQTPTSADGVSHITIDFSATFPANLSLSAAQQLFASDARLLASALLHTLPGGTYSALLAEMLKERSSHFVVSLKDESR